MSGDEWHTIHELRPGRRQYAVEQAWKARCYYRAANALYKRGEHEEAWALREWAAGYRGFAEGVTFYYGGVPDDMTLDDYRREMEAVRKAEIGETRDD